jgi:hypothetical protein
MESENTGRHGQLRWAAPIGGRATRCAIDEAGRRGVTRTVGCPDRVGRRCRSGAEQGRGATRQEMSPSRLWPSQRPVARQ